MFQEVQKFPKAWSHLAAFPTGLTTGDMEMQWLQLRTKCVSCKKKTKMHQEPLHIVCEAETTSRFLHS